MSYRDRKESARIEAIDLMEIASEMHLSYADIIAMQTYFTHIARRYGLTREFRENGLI